MATYEEAKGWPALVNLVFPGNKRVATGRPRVIVKSDTGAPANAIGTHKGLLCYNEADSKAYICTTIATTWTEITGSGDPM